MEAFFVVLVAALLIGVGVLAVLAARRVAGHDAGEPEEAPEDTESTEDTL